MYAKVARKTASAQTLAALILGLEVRVDDSPDILPGIRDHSANSPVMWRHAVANTTGCRAVKQGGKIQLLE